LQDAGKQTNRKHRGKWQVLPCTHEAKKFCHVYLAGSKYAYARLEIIGHPMHAVLDEYWRMLCLQRQVFRLKYR
jgi:hypothetical protein